MAHVIVRQEVFVTEGENKTGIDPSSLSEVGVEVKRIGNLSIDPIRNRCVFVVSPRHARPGAIGPFCGAPAIPRSAYCARHHRICVLSAASAAGQADAATLATEAEAAEPPPELAHLIPPTLPEQQGEEQPAELRVLLDHPPPAPGTELPE